jgi:dTDP-4-dehydrorhamnose 3,5-epimerase
LHFVLIPPGQAKDVHGPAGKEQDVVVEVNVDGRVGSPTFAVHDSVLLDSQQSRAGAWRRDWGTGPCSWPTGVR